MFIKVRLLKGYQEPLLYAVPEDWQQTNLLGSFVRVPIRNQESTALVEKVYREKPKTSFQIRPALSLEEFPADEKYLGFIKQLSEYYQVDPFHFLRRIRDFIHQKEAKEQEVRDQEQVKKMVCLTPEQEEAYSFQNKALLEQQFQPMLLHGVTGSGKTEVYKKLIESAINQNKTTLLLLPEVTLAVKFHQLLKQQLDPSIQLFSFHSACSPKEKRLLWKKLLLAEPIVIIGVHLPILLPIQNLGQIIIDEEHEIGYQEKKHPKVNSKEAALMRAKLYNLPILLGSATPSIASLYNIDHKGWAFFQLKKRFSGGFPTIEKICLADKKQRKNFWISTKLHKAIENQLQKKEQTILFLNRRGFSFFVQCKQCSFIFNCSNCSVSLTLHSDRRLTCHYCTYNLLMPNECPDCKAKEKDLLKKGIGTQQLVDILEKMLPQARIARADLDTTVNKKRWQETMEKFEQGEIDILVGTQTITKGYHFPRVTLVGVLWADLNLAFPMYNAVETTLQQLIQVAGRAGRDSEKSTVIIQSIADHPIFSYLDEINYLTFYKEELENRKLVTYPPLTRFAEIELKAANEEVIEKEALNLAFLLQKLIKEKNWEIRLLGPAKPPVHKVKNWQMRKIYLKSDSISQIIKLYRSIDHSKFTSSIFFTPNPLS